MSLGTERKIVNAIGGRMARPCEDCRRRHARYYCAADDAFLCQICDGLIHSVNPLAQRHERIRLKTSSSSSSASSLKARAGAKDLLPKWHRGFKKKARTSRRNPNPKVFSKADLSTDGEQMEGSNYPLLVPELGDDLQEESEEQLLYRVPIFDPMVGEFRNSNMTMATLDASQDDKKSSSAFAETSDLDVCHALDGLPCFLASDMDLADFAADVDSLLGHGLEEDLFCMEGLGLLDTRDCGLDCLGSGRLVKLEEGDVRVFAQAQAMDAEVDLSRESMELNFDYDTTTTGEEDEEKVRIIDYGLEEKHDIIEKKKILLKLDHEAVMMAWAGRGTPWTGNERPEINPDDCLNDFAGIYGGDHINACYDQVGGVSGSLQQLQVGDGGREARVSRYREKRRTRLFSKKIRYEVRKLNAEKRPRMKGRFVKRTSSFGTASTAGFAF